MRLSEKIKVIEQYCDEYYDEVTETYIQLIGLYNLDFISDDTKLHLEKEIDLVYQDVLDMIEEEDFVEKEIQFPIRVGFKHPCIKDASGRLIIKTPEWMLSNSKDDDYEKRFYQFSADLETIVGMANIGYEHTIAEKIIE